MIPSPPIHHPSDARHSGWLSASTALAYCKLTNRPAVASPTLSGNARRIRSSPSPTPTPHGKRLGRLDATSSNLMPRAKSP